MGKINWSLRNIKKSKSKYVVIVFGVIFVAFCWSMLQAEISSNQKLPYTERFVEDKSIQKLGVRVVSVHGQTVQVDVTEGSSQGGVSSMKVDSQGITYNRKYRQIVFNVNSVTNDEVFSSTNNFHDIVTINNVPHHTGSLVVQISQNGGLVPANTNPYRTDKFLVPVDVP